jgi:hypothetical protein
MHIQTDRGMLTLTVNIYQICFGIILFAFTFLV